MMDIIALNNRELSKYQISPKGVGFKSPQQEMDIKDYSSINSNKQEE